jgi:hypothetical protein
MCYLREVTFGTEFLSWLFFFASFPLRLVAFPSTSICAQIGNFFFSFFLFLQFNKMLPVQGQAEIINKICGALDKYESKLSEINQKVRIILGKHTMIF